MASIPTQDEILAATRKGQEAMLAAVKSWLETVRTATPKLTSAYAPLTDRLPRLPSVSLPFADKLPTPEEAVASAYDLAEQLLASQRRFAEELVKATAPLLPGRGESSPETSSRSAWRDAAAVSEAKPVTVSEAKPVTVSEAKPVTVSEAKPVTVSEPKPVAATASAAAEAAPTRPAAKSTPARPTARTTAAKSTTAKSAPNRTTASRAPRGTAPEGTEAS